MQGAVSAVVYQNYDNGYAVLRLDCGSGQTVTVVGTIPLLAVGERLVVTGRWASHANYGRQFEAEFLERLMPQTGAEILAYLSSGAIKGIGVKMAARIVSQFGDDTLRILEREPEKLAQVPGISQAKAIAVGQLFRAQSGLRQIMEFFALHHLPAELAVRTYKIYGERTMELLYQDPYLLMDDGLDAPFAPVPGSWAWRPTIRGAWRRGCCSRCGTTWPPVIASCPGTSWPWPPGSCFPSPKRPRRKGLPGCWRPSG